MKRTSATSVIMFSLVLLLCAGTFAFAGGQQSSSTENWPARPITLIIPYSPGGMADLIGRMWADALNRELGANFVVVNQPGSSGEMGTLNIVKAKPDGYTLGIMNCPDMFLSELSNPDFAKEFSTPTSVRYIAALPNTINAYFMKKNNKYGITSWDQFLAYAKANPGKLTSTAPGGLMHRVFAVSVMKHYDIKFSPISYPGGGDAQAAFLGDHVDILSTTAGALSSMEALGAFPILWGDPVPPPSYPNIELANASGLILDFLGVRTTLVAPADVPQEILDKLTDACKKIAQDPAYGFRKRIEDLNYLYEPVFGDDLTALFTGYYNKAKNLVETYGDEIRPNY
ncbi:Bug family tripartite tricarboxylate transporter substrate binding protein [Breznakiella homolactica]|uniref:Tripartite tricarboxylate transporter substrate binding protein n=1 Tax=Breznakiella homolactica TaxID=2798577 RepID=A0A7T8BAJ4_9SPIR|nr:tripartite tricarboxylate transporter substrate binding protein [Breznakiella homolactica]QQO09572.1 tripartite tricarboxylate transporter substrate binding protein [Breznakiella homolactica]